MAKIRDRYNQAPHLTQDTSGKVTNSQLDNTKESQEVSPFSAGDHKASIKQGYRYHKKHISKFNHRHPEVIVKYSIGLKALLQQGI